MIGILLFDNHDDLLYVFGDEEFGKKIENVAKVMGISPSSLDFPVDSKNLGNKTRADLKDIQSMILMQIFSPLLTSYRIMSHEFQNSYDGITCDDGSTVAFYEKMNFLLIAVSKSSINAVHLVKVCFGIMQHVCGPSFSLCVFDIKFVIKKTTVV